MVFKINFLPKLSKLFIRKSNTSGLIKNDGTIDTSNYIQTSQTPGLVKNDGTIDENISTHTHGNLTNDGKVGTASDKIITTTTGGAIQASDSITKSQISDFPSTMTPSSHNHTVSEITNFPSTMTPSSHQHGNLTNDGKIGTASNKIITTTTGGAIQASDSIVSTYIKEAKSHSNIGSSQNDNLQDVFDDIDTQLGYKISTSNTSGLVKNDGSIDITKYLPIINNPTIPNNSLSNIKSNGIYYIGNASSLSDAPISDLPTICMIVEGVENEYIRQIVFNLVTDSDVPDYRTWIRFGKTNQSHTDIWIFTNWTETTVPQSISDLTGVNTNGLVKNDGTIDTMAYAPTETSITDLNLLKDSGLFYFLVDNISNVPESMNKFVVLVEGDTFVKQTLTSLPSSKNTPTYKTWVRFYIGSGISGTTGWTSWIETTFTGHNHAGTDITDNTWTETYLKNDNDVTQTSILCVNEALRLCQLRFIQQFNSAQAQTYFWNGTYGRIPDGKRPVNNNVYGSIWVGSEGNTAGGTLRVDTDGGLSAKFNQSISNLTAYATVMWYY